MSERADRAKKMKTDPEPDFTIPMIIDFIGSPLAPDNAIRKAYYGGGFYSGYVIDCDGTILVARDWAWFGSGKSWWQLPLAPIESLHTFLDAYLAKPPRCYKPPENTLPE
jgi:hypothetical protein